MKAKKKLPINLDDHRLDGDTISAGCFSCPLLKECGGYTRRGGGWSCMDRCRSCDAKCDLVCLKKQSAFARALLEVGGFGFQGIGSLHAPARSRLPRYVPVLQHGDIGEVALDWVALPFRTMMRIQRGVYGPLAATAAELRRSLGLRPETRIILLGTGKDRPIETYWRYRRRDQVPRRLAPLALECAVAPNYSLFLEDPRPHHLFNRKRGLICADEWSAAGIPTVPYLHTVTLADWTYWERFLLAHPEVDVVAKEFQTGLANPIRGEEAIAQLARMQSKLQRRLHVVAVGAAKFRGALARDFDGWTVIDSVPFMKAVKRRAATPGGRRILWSSAKNEDVADLVAHNVSAYENWLTRA
jgi:hypothetical protein